MKFLNRFLAVLLSVILLASVCILPANAVANVPDDETYEAFDEITFDDLFIGTTSMAGETKDGSRNYTYNATSPTYSTKFKFRWTPGGNELRFDLYLDDWVYPFCFAAKYPNQSNFGATAGPNGAWHIVPSNSSLIVNMSEAVVAGNAYDMEIGRLKVKTGTNLGKYYVYWKVNGTLVQSYYYGGVSGTSYTSEGKTVTLSNKIIISSPSGNKFSGIPVPEAYDDYDEIGLNDLYVGEDSLSGIDISDGDISCTYNATSPSYSAVFKFRWIPDVTSPKFSVYFDAFVYPFCFAAKLPNQSNFGATAGPNGAWHLVPSNGNLMVNMDEPASHEKTYDMEIGRLKVTKGVNTGKYYVYWKINDSLIQSYYYSGVSDGIYENNTALSNKIIINMPAGNVFTAVPESNNYESYDEIGFDDLYLGGDSLSGQMLSGGDNNCTYNATSPTYSVIFKFRWIPGEKTPKFSLYFDAWVYPFCFAVKTPNQTGFGKTAGPNGSWHLVPSNDCMIVDMDSPIVTGKSYDMEIARLKIKSGANAGKYYVYWKIDGELIQSYYYDGVSNGVYGSGTALSNKIIISLPNGNKFCADSSSENYEDYDEIGYEDLSLNGQPVKEETAISGSTVFTYNRTSTTGSAIFRYRWKAGSIPKFQMSFEKSASNMMEYLFGAWLDESDDNYPNGKMWLRPSYGPETNMPASLEPYSYHNVEFARLKVKNGANIGKYRVYIKIDDITVAEDYVASDIVSNNLTYTSNPNATSCDIKSNEIFFAFWGTEGNAIRAYEAPSAYSNDGIRGDFDDNKTIDANDIVSIVSILLGAKDVGKKPAEIADFNNDGIVDIRELIAMKKYLAPAAVHTKSGKLAIGIQEHLLEDDTKTASYIADASAVIGATSYRLSMSIHYLYRPTITNGVEVKETYMNQFREMFYKLKAKGIDEILYVSAGFVAPYGYSDPLKTHGHTVPDPEADPVNYKNWLKVNAAAYKALAREFPELNYYEPFNEINVDQGSHLEKYGVSWDAPDEVRADYKYTVKERAGIMADLCWYISSAVKSVNRKNQVTTPSISFNTASHVEDDFLEEFYNYIESGICPRGMACGDINSNNYFTILNIHSYKGYSRDNSDIDSWVAEINSKYNVVVQHNDTAKPVWMTETGCASSTGRTKIAENIIAVLEAIDERLTYIDTVQIYQLANSSGAAGLVSHEMEYGLFYSGDDTESPYGYKDYTKSIYSYMHNGSTNYAPLDALVSKYAS